jgi:hypothetical protein
VKNLDAALDGDKDVATGGGEEYWVCSFFFFFFLLLFASGLMVSVEVVVSFPGFGHRLGNVR